MNSLLHRLALTLSLVFLLAACGGGNTVAPEPQPVVDALQSYREQVVNWAVCDSTILGDKTAEVQPYWQPVADRLRCASVRVPLDYTQPSRGDAVVSVMRIAAANPTQRKGALFFNPVGPGDDGLIFTFKLIKAFGGSNPSDPLGALQLRLLDVYDLVGFSPRGTGASTALLCATNELVRFINFSPKGQSAENVSNMFYNARKTAEACLKNPVTPYINTETTAQDMDLLRSLMGDDKLNYVGTSYGTWLGTWYASRFPERVGRMVLDSSVDFSAPLERTFNLQPVARQRLFDEVLAPYAVRHPNTFNLGANLAEVRAVMPSLSMRVQDVLAIELSNLVYERINADPFLGTVAAARGLDAVLAARPQGLESEIRSDLEAFVFIPNEVPRNALVRGAAHRLYNIYLQRWVNRRPSSIQLDRSAATNQAVKCNDTPSTTDVDYWINLGDNYAQRYPMFTLTIALGNPCIFWGGPTVTKPALSAMGSLDVLMVQSQFDGATATEGAMSAFAKLPDAHLVYVPQEFQHGVYPYMDQCVDTAVARYLLGESPSQRETSCPAQPLEQDALKVRAMLLSAPSSSAYLDPKAAAALINEAKRSMKPLGSVIP